MLESRLATFCFLLVFSSLFKYFFKTLKFKLKKVGIPSLINLEKSNKNGIKWFLVNVVDFAKNQLNNFLRNK